MTHRIDSVAIIGASLAGLRAAETLRTAGYDGRVDMIGAEPHRPYNRPPLSKALLTGDLDPTMISLEGDEGIGAHWHLGDPAVHLDCRSRVVELASGNIVRFDRAIIATGARARWPQLIPHAAGIHTLRTLDDAVSLRADLVPGKRLLIIGAGFIGCEVAASARKLGVDVAMIDKATAPLAGAIGDVPASLLAWKHREHAVRTHFGQAITRVHLRQGRFAGVELTDGTRVPGDLAVIGMGAEPCVDWLESSGLVIDDGVVCDSTLKAVGSDCIFAAGDVMRWPHPALGGKLVRAEHWTNAAASGVTAAHNLLQVRTRTFDLLPEFWSDQYELSIRGVGITNLGADFRIVHGSIEADAFVGVYESNGRVVGAIAVNANRALAPWRREIADTLKSDPTR